MWKKRRAYFVQAPLTTFKGDFNSDWQEPCAEVVLWLIVFLFTLITVILWCNVWENMSMSECVNLSVPIWDCFCAQWYSASNWVTSQQNRRQTLLTPTIWSRKLRNLKRCLPCTETSFSLFSEWVKMPLKPQYDESTDFVLFLQLTFQMGLTESGCMTKNDNWQIDSYF